MRISDKFKAGMACFIQPVGGIRMGAAGPISKSWPAQSPYITATVVEPPSWVDVLLEQSNSFRSTVKSESSVLMWATYETDGNTYFEWFNLVKEDVYTEEEYARISLAR